MTDFHGIDPYVAGHDAQEGPGASGVGSTGIVATVAENLVAVLLLAAGLVGGGAWMVSQMPSQMPCQIPSPVTGPPRGAAHRVAQTLAAADRAAQAAAPVVGGFGLRPSAGPGSGDVRWSNEHVAIKGGTVRSMLAMAFGVSPSRVHFEVEEPTALFDAHFTGGDWAEVLREALQRHLGLVGQRETRRHPAYALRRHQAALHGLGPGLKKREGAAAAYLGFDERVGEMAFPVVNSIQLAALIQMRLGHRVVDQTGLKAPYEVDMKLPEAFHLTPEALEVFVRSGQAVPDADVAVFAHAARSALGLDLVRIEGGQAIDVLVVGKTGGADVQGVMAGRAPRNPVGHASGRDAQRGEVLARRAVVVTASPVDRLP